MKFAINIQIHLTEIEFDKEDYDIILFLLVESDVTNLLNFLPKSRPQSVLVKPWLQSRLTKSVYHNTILQLKLQDPCDYRKYFRMEGDTSFLISFHMLNLT